MSAAAPLSPKRLPRTASEAGRLRAPDAVVTHASCCGIRTPHQGFETNAMRQSDLPTRTFRPQGLPAFPEAEFIEKFYVRSSLLLPGRRTIDDDATSPLELGSHRTHPLRLGELRIECRDPDGRAWVRSQCPAAQATGWGAVSSRQPPGHGTCELDGTPERSHGSDQTSQSSSQYNTDAGLGGSMGIAAQIGSTADRPKARITMSGSGVLALRSRQVAANRDDSRDTIGQSLQAPNTPWQRLKQ